ncbi:ABC-2 transporter permease [Paenibacillus monticola]|uniref:ABC-2 transporter permease n=1 Tax=Paenibacillus monticola TaxID=2666075 RepID=A0A7X2H6M2_9BACL|nr:ABC-2 transporter permease [Paenibacillus monticola]MRN54395.1 hypothetical protein [Paenibacillus monticola]
MHNLLYLLRKDFVLLKSFILFVLLYNLFMAAIQIDNYCMYAAFPSLLLLTCSCSYDTQHHNQRFVISLPLRRREIVRAKYLTLVPFATFGVACSVVLYIVLNILGHSIDPDYWRAVGLTLFLIPLFAAIYLPIHYWIGHKGSQVNIIFNVVIVLATINAGSSVQQSPLLTKMLHIQVQDHLQLIGLTGIVYLFILYGSYVTQLSQHEIGR